MTQELKIDISVDDLTEVTGALGGLSDTTYYDGTSLVFAETAEYQKVQKLLRDGGAGAGHLANRKSGAADQIDSDAERARLKYITPGAGQALTYQEKAAELARYDEDTQPRLTEYPLLAAEIGITADSLKGVADAVRAALAAWRTAGAAIERTRLKAKADVEKARDVAAIQAVVDAIEWP